MRPIYTELLHIDYPVGEGKYFPIIELVFPFFLRKVSWIQRTFEDILTLFYHLQTPPGFNPAVTNITSEFPFSRFFIHQIKKWWEELSDRGQVQACLQESPLGEALKKSFQRGQEPLKRYHSWCFFLQSYFF